VSLAAALEEEMNVAVVYDPVADELFTGVRGQGATLNGARLAPPRGAQRLASALIGTGFSYLSSGRADQAEVLRFVLPRVGDIRRPGSAALSLAWVAAGRLDAFFERGLKAWDFVAGALIAEEAGCGVSGLAGQPPSEGLVVAAHPDLFPEFEALLDEAIARHN
jgi:myo-inositol-1(or 4)-monophosphatase